MKEILIILKNFYTKKTINVLQKETDLDTYRELIKELDINLQEIIIYSEAKKMFISENNKIQDKDKIILFNTKGQVL